MFFWFILSKLLKLQDKIIFVRKESLCNHLKHQIMQSKAIFYADKDLPGHGRHAIHNLMPL